LEQMTEEAESLLYARQVGEAGQTVPKRDAELLLARLDEARRQPSGRDHRGWEWHYLDRLARPFAREVRFAGHSDFLSPDGDALIRPPTMTWREGVRLEWQPGSVRDRATGRLLGEIPVAQPEARMAKVVISADGRLVAWVESQAGVASPPLPGVQGEFRVRVADRETGRQEVVLGPFPVQPEVKTGAGGEWLVASVDTDGLSINALWGHPGRDGPYPRLVVWRRGQDRPSEVQIRTGPDNFAYAPVMVSPDASRAVVLHTPAPPSDQPLLKRDTVLELWDLTSPPRRRGEPKSHADGLAPVAFSADGAYLAVLFRPRSVAVYETTGLDQVGRWELPDDALLQQGMNGCPIGAVSRDGRRVALGGSRGLVLVGDRIDPPSEDHPRVALGRWRTDLVWGPAQLTFGGGLELPPLPGNNEMGFGPGGELVIYDTQLNRTAADGPLMWTIPLPAGVGYAAFWPDALTADGLTLRPQPAAGPRIVYVPTAPVAGPGDPKPRDWPVLVWDVADGKVVRRLTVTGLSVTGADLSADGRRLLVGVQVSEKNLLPLPFAPPPPPAAPDRDKPAAPPPPPPPAVRSPPGDPPRGAEKDGPPPPPSRPSPPPGFGEDYRVSLRDLDDPGARELAVFVPQINWGFSGGRWVVNEGGEPGSFQVWSGATGKLGLELKPRPGEGFSRPFFQPDGRRLVLATWRQPTDLALDRPAAPVPVTLRCFDPDAAKELWSAPLPDPFPVNAAPDLTGMGVRGYVAPPAVGFAPDGRQLAVFVKVNDGAVRG
jgi:hypothetical protein